jgi:hypothetical protein
VPQVVQVTICPPTIYVCVEQAALADVDTTNNTANISFFISSLLEIWVLLRLHEWDEHSS